MNMAESRMVTRSRVRIGALREAYTFGAELRRKEMRGLGDIRMFTPKTIKTVSGRDVVCPGGLIFLYAPETPHDIKIAFDLAIKAGYLNLNLNMADLSPGLLVTE